MVLCFSANSNVTSSISHCCCCYIGAVFLCADGTVRQRANLTTISCFTDSVACVLKWVIKHAYRVTFVRFSRLVYAKQVKLVNEDGCE